MAMATSTRRVALPRRKRPRASSFAKAEVRRAESVAAYRLHLPEVGGAIAARLSDAEDADELTIASNAVLRAGKLDEAEQATRDLAVGFPEVNDGYDRRGTAVGTYEFRAAS
jgi:hypothetical protein